MQVAARKIEYQELRESLEGLSKSLESMMRTVASQKKLLLAIQKRIPQGQQRDV